jgi:hypothetical protein
MNNYPFQHVDTLAIMNKNDTLYYYNASEDIIINKEIANKLKTEKNYIFIKELYLIGKKKDIIKHVIELNNFLSDKPYKKVKIKENVQKRIDKHINENQNLKKLYNMQKSISTKNNMSKYKKKKNEIKYRYLNYEFYNVGEPIILI